eukprot:1158733-Pelagomonas_calceolata.AAC.3
MDVLKCGRKSEVETERLVHIAEATHPRHALYANNFTRTTKYTLLTYLPKSLFEQKGNAGIPMPESPRNLLFDFIAASFICSWWWPTYHSVVTICKNALQRKLTRETGTAKRSLWCLCMQYRRLANIYFTAVAALSLTEYSPVRWELVNKGSRGSPCSHKHVPMTMLETGMYQQLTT